MTRISCSAVLAAVAIAAGAAVGGCTASPNYYSETESQQSRELKVDAVRLVEPVAFSPRSAALSEPERARLAQFLARQKVGYGDEIFVVMPVAASSDAATLASRRARTVADALPKLGAAFVPTTIASDETVGADNVLVVVGRNVVTPPACSNWIKPSGIDQTVTPLSNLGCANVHNLGLMVADPGELEQGRSLGPADGEQTAAGIKRYRDGKITPLLKEGTGTGIGGQSGGGGGGGQ
jgi:pilus assembly protein CpaD